MAVPPSALTSAANTFHPQSSPSTSYVYEPFQNPQEQLRLLTILPSRVYNAVIQTKLSTHSFPANDGRKRDRVRPLFEIPSYRAISYVWGTGKKDKSIILNGYLFPVTSMVHAALQYFRMILPDKEMTVWIDAICIDQDNIEQKAAHLPIMREVYHLAQSTSIFLGPGNPESQRVMLFVSNLTNPYFIQGIQDPEDRSASNRAGLLSLAAGGARSIISSVSKVSQLTMNISQDNKEWEFKGLKFEYDKILKQHTQPLTTWKPSRACLERFPEENFGEMARLIPKVFGEYFSRMWTAQEAIAGITCSIHGSEHGTIFSSLLKAVYYLRRTQGMDELFVEQVIKVGIYTALWYKGIRQPLRELLFWCRDRKCFDDRDRVYALIGLINGRMDPLVQPNTSLSVAEVYANATKYIARSEQCLDIICVRRATKHDSQQVLLPHKLRAETLASWARDFRRFGSSEGRTPLLDPSGQQKLYHASLAEPYVKFGSTDQPIHTLYTTGLKIGEIEKISQSVWSDEISDRIIQTQWNWANTLIKSQIFPLVSATSRLFTCLSTLISLLLRLHNLYLNDRSDFWLGIENQVQELINNVYLDIHLEYLLVLVAGQISPGSRCNTAEALSTLKRACVRNPDGDTALSALCEAIRSGSHGRRFVVLNGGYFGSVPEGQTTGDVVCVLVGCSVPVCLRLDTKTEDWVLGGGCYISRCMDGEVLEHTSDWQAITRTYILI